MLTAPPAQADTAELDVKWDDLIDALLESDMEIALPPPIPFTLLPMKELSTIDMCPMFLAFKPPALE